MQIGNDNLHFCNPNLNNLSLQTEKTINFNFRFFFLDHPSAQHIATVLPKSFKFSTSLTNFKYLAQLDYSQYFGKNINIYIGHIYAAKI